MHHAVTLATSTSKKMDLQATVPSQLPLNPNEIQFLLAKLENIQPSLRS